MNNQLWIQNCPFLSYSARYKLARNNKLWQLIKKVRSIEVDSVPWVRLATIGSQWLILFSSTLPGQKTSHPRSIGRDIPTGSNVAEYIVTVLVVAIIKQLHLHKMPNEPQIQMPLEIPNDHRMINIQRYYFVDLNKIIYFSGFSGINLF